MINANQGLKINSDYQKIASEYLDVLLFLKS